MKKFTIQAIFLVIIVFLGLAIATSRLTPDLPFFPQRFVTSQVRIKNIVITVEIADNQTKRATGLSNRNSLEQNSGMLFVFPKEDKYAFWMKNTKIPLDIIWVKKNQVVDIIKEVKPPEPNQKDETLPIYLPKEPINMVLEVNSGFVDNHNIQIGDIIEIK